MEGRRENRERRKRREEGLERIAKSEERREEGLERIAKSEEPERKQKGMGREGMERWKEENKSYLIGKVFLD